MTRAFLPDSWQSILASGVAVLLLLLLGARFSSRAGTGARVLCAWLLGTAAVAGVHFAALGEPAGWRMLALIAVAFAALKTVVVASSPASLSSGAWWRFAVLWVGMDPRPFLASSASGSARQRGRGNALIGRSLAAFLTGLALLAVARRLAASGGAPVWSIALLFVALSLLVHFGACGVVAGLWRRRGVDVAEAFVAPQRATSLREFWSQRWNRPFSEMTRSAVYRPVVRAWGRGPALCASFVFSGLLHELAISVPVGAGYGLPLAYFLLQTGAVSLEEQFTRRGCPVRGVPGRIWCVLWLVLPLPLLFPAPFRAAIAAPLLGS